METYRRPFPTTARGLVEHLAALGYRVRDRHRYRNDLNPRLGPWDAEAWGLVDVDTGRSAFHYQGRRDARFQMLQALRRECPPILNRGRLVEL